MIFPSGRMQVGVFFFFFFSLPEEKRDGRPGLKGKLHVDIDRVRQFQQDQHYPPSFQPLTDTICNSAETHYR